MSLDRIRDEHRLWLAGHGLLDRPWFVLGSAPNPTIPPGITDRAALICINNSGVLAAERGLPPAALTVRNRNKKWRPLAGLSVPLVLWACDRNALQIGWRTFLIGLRCRLGEVRVMPSSERHAIYEHMLQPENGDPEIGKPSTGIIAVLYGLFVGVPDIILAGMSMDKKGYSYQTSDRRMLHVDEDRTALQIIARRYRGISTTEASIAADTRLPLSAHLGSGKSGGSASR